MSIPVHELEAQVLSLRAEDRAHLLELLIESFEPDSGIQAAWVAEAVRRRAGRRSNRTFVGASFTSFPTPCCIRLSPTTS